jgi:hypothetical protein
MKRVLLILLIWFFSSSSVSAGCAWVLWELRFTPAAPPNELGLYDLGLTTVVSSWESKRGCWEALSTRIKETPNRKGKIDQDGDKFKMDLANGWILELKCLPETVDPKQTLRES